MADFVFNIAADHFGSGNLDLETAGIGQLLLENTSGVNRTFDDIATLLATTNVTELTSTAYSRTTAITGSTVILNDTANKAFWYFGDITYSSIAQSASETVTGAVMFWVQTSTAGDSGLVPISYHDISPAITPNGSDITISASSTANGYLQFLTTT